MAELEIDIGDIHRRTEQGRHDAIYILGLQAVGVQQGVFDLI